MIKIAIVEDEALYAQQLQGFLHQYEKENGELFDITVYTDGDQIVHKYQSQYDLILMDVEMKFMDGMSAAEEIRKMDTEVVIIFITNMAQYAIRGYAVDALDYVLKPVSYFAFSQRLNRAIGRMKKREQKVIMVNIKGGAVRVNIANIYYIESQGHTLILHTILGDYETSGTMKEMEEKGILCYGPYAADGFMGSGNYTHFDGILAMYHDQGLAPFKALAMDDGVNYTAGLPVVRTSPAHGTAYDIAGQGLASEDSFRQAVYVAIDVFRNRQREKAARANPLRKQYYEKRDDSDKLKLDTVDEE